MTKIAPLLVPGRHVDAQQLEATLQSVRSELGDAPILALEADFGEQTQRVSAEQALAAADLLAPIRPGDVLVAGSLQHRSLALSNHPPGTLAIASHERIDAAGTPLLRQLPPPPGTPADELLLHPAYELSAILLRSERVTAAQLGWLLRPFGDQLLIGTISTDQGLLPSAELAARVLVDPDRHGFAGQADRLATFASAIDPGAPGASTVRRELLRTTWVEPLGPAERADLAALLPADVAARPDVAPVLEDLSWILAIQSEALATERLRWDQGQLGGAEPVETLLETNLPKTEAELSSEIHRLHLELLHREAMIDRLNDELRLRDAQVQRIEATR